jgi:hypothetical protein
VSSLGVLSIIIYCATDTDSEIKWKFCVYFMHNEYFFRIFVYLWFIWWCCQ